MKKHSKRRGRRDKYDEISPADSTDYTFTTRDVYELFRFAGQQKHGFGKGFGRGMN
jgi:hypothetical protein